MQFLIKDKCIVFVVTFVTGSSLDLDSNSCSSLDMSSFTESSLDHSDSLQQV